MDVGTLTANNKAHVESKDSKTGEIIRDEDKKDITIENKYEIAKRGDFVQRITESNGRLLLIRRMRTLQVAS